MAFIKFELDEPTSPPIKLTNTLILISEPEWAQAGLDGADAVNLFWDAQTHLIGLSSTNATDKSKFAAKKTAKGMSIPSRKFFAKFDIAHAQAEGGLTKIGDLFAFKVNLPNVPSFAVDGAATPKRRGRKPKNAA